MKSQSVVAALSLWAFGAPCVHQTRRLCHRCQSGHPRGFTWAAALRCYSSSGYSASGKVCAALQTDRQSASSVALQDECLESAPGEQLDRQTTASVPLHDDCSEIQNKSDIQTTSSSSLQETPPFEPGEPAGPSPEGITIEDRPSYPANLPALFHSRLRTTDVAHRAWEHILQQGQCVIDMTAGNGFDTLFLAQRVLPREVNGEDTHSGHVWAFDVQVCSPHNSIKHVS